MNPQQPGQPQGQAGQQQQRPAGQQPQQQARPPTMYTADAIEALPYLTDDEKSKYKTGLNGLWAKVNGSPADSPESQQARRKIAEFSRMLVGKIQQRGRTTQGQQGQPGQPQPPRPPPPAQQAQPQAPTQMSPVAPHASAQIAQPQQQQQQQPPPQQAQPNNAASTGNADASAPTQAGQPQKPRLPEQIIKHINSMAFRPPPSILSRSPAEAQKWVEDMKDRYGRALLMMDNAKKQLTVLEKMVTDRQAGGNPFNEAESKQWQERKAHQMRMYSEAKNWVDNFRKSQGTAAGGAAGAVAGQQPAGQQPGTPQQQGNVPNAAAVNAAMAAAKQQQQQGSRASPATHTQTPVQPPRPGPSIQQPANPQQQQQMKPEPSQTTPINPNHAGAMATPQQRAQTTQVTPVANPPAGQGRALTHSAALSLANSRASNTPGSAPIPGQPQGQQPQQQQQQQMQQQQQHQQQQQQLQQQQSVGTPGSAGATPVGQNTMAAPQQGHPHAHPGTQQQPTIQSKMPIPKQLPEKAQAVPSGVAVGGGVMAGRPTMSQGSGTLGGVMNQPAVSKVQAYNHEAEGDHVLSKKKLDELVRQVCGGTAEGQEGNMLTPDVEESVLNMADSFMDNVLHAACRNAKERGSKVLEIRDIQLVLERTYNIRVPGYSSDELRTVRKVQPAPGWIAKMSAVQAAKVMPGKGE